MFYYKKFKINFKNFQVLIHGLDSNYDYDLDYLENDLSDDQELSIDWNDLGFKVVCEEEDWRQQFDSIRTEFNECLNVSTNLNVVENETPNLSPSSVYIKPSANPYCR